MEIFAKTNVNLEGKTVVGEHSKGDDVELEKVKKYAAENKVSFSEAYKVMLKTGQIKE